MPTSTILNDQVIKGSTIPKVAISKYKQPDSQSIFFGIVSGALLHIALSFAFQVEERRSSKSVTAQASFENNMDSDSDEEEERGKGQRRRVNLPPMRQKLTGHRNARTMIKVTTISQNIKFLHQKAKIAKYY